MSVKRLCHGPPKWPPKCFLVATQLQLIECWNKSQLSFANASQTLMRRFRKGSPSLWRQGERKGKERPCGMNALCLSHPRSLRLTQSQMPFFWSGFPPFQLLPNIFQIEIFLLIDCFCWFKECRTCLLLSHAHCMECITLRLCSNAKMSHELWSAFIQEIIKVLWYICHKKIEKLPK